MKKSDNASCITSTERVTRLTDKPHFLTNLFTLFETYKNENVQFEVRNLYCGYRELVKL